MKSLNWLFLFIALLLLSCSGSPPGIVNTDWMVVYRDDQVLGTVYQELNFFVQVQDEDGDADISEVNLIRDDLNWSWKMDSSNWAVSDQDGEYWVGANGLTLGKSEDLPEGDYRLLVIDRSGKRDETQVTIRQPGKDSDSLPFPSIRQGRNSIDIQSDVSPLVLWFYDNQAQLVVEEYVKPGTILLSDFLNEQQRQQITWFYVYYQDEREGYGLKSGPYLFERE